MRLTFPARLAGHPVFLLLGGGLGALSMPPYDWPVMLLPMMMQAVWLLDGIAATSYTWDVKIKKALWGGWLLGFGYFTAGMWWLAYAFLVEPDQFAWLIPLGIFGLPAVLALFVAAGLGLGLGLYYYLRNRGTSSNDPQKDSRRITIKRT